jgi:predicted nucleotidyltransferase
MGISEVLKDKREDILRIAAKHGAHHIRVIGSVARGEARPDSDVDFLVELEPDRSLFDHAALMIELAAFLGRKVDVATERGMRPHIRERVLQDAVPL